MGIKKHCIILILTLLSVHVAKSQERVLTESFEQKVYFREAYRYVDATYRENKEALENIKSAIDSAQRDSALVSVEIQAWASPTGIDKYNKLLAQNRTNELVKWIVSNCNVTEDKVTNTSGGIGWGILRELVAASDATYKESVSEILDNTPLFVMDNQGRIITGRNKKLMDHNHGRTWNDMKERFFADIRCGLAVVVNIRKQEPEIEEQLTEPVTTEIPDTTEQIVVPAPIIVDTIDTVPTIAPVVEEWERKLYVKTNALGWGLAIANAAVEIDLCKHWSFQLPVYYSAWDYFSETTKFRTLAVQPEIRYWFSEKNLCNDGWFAGAHFGLAWYNIATDGEYRTQDHDGTSPALGGGLAVGYRLPISKNNRWKMEFSIGAGAYKLHHDKFRNYHNGLLVNTEKKTYIGIDQASVSFSYTFDLKRIGGAR